MQSKSDFYKQESLLNWISDREETNPTRESMRQGRKLRSDWPAPTCRYSASHLPPIFNVASAWALSIDFEVENEHILHFACMEYMFET